MGNSTKKKLVRMGSSITLCLSAASLSIANDGMAQVISTEERFQDLFLTAGYGTAFGAACGAALLSFQAKPEENLKFVAIGASIGFLSGSLLGSYVIIAPSLKEMDSDSAYGATMTSRPDTLLTLIPSFSAQEKWDLASVSAQFVINRF